MVRIGTRKHPPELQKLFDEGKNVYSISKANTIDNCLYEAFLTYKKGEKGVNGVYGIMGTKIHDTLEEIVNDKATESKLIHALRDELSDLDMLGIDFPKDFRGGTGIRDSWIADMEHFCKNFTRPKGKFITEKFFLLKLKEDRYLQGYIDLIRKNNDETISIYDWKTSTDFNKDELIEHGRQLIAYVVSEEQNKKTVNEIAWIMLKYVSVSFWGKARSNSKQKTQLTKICKRGKLLGELKSYIESDLCDAGYGEIDIDIMLNNAIKTNSFDGIPKEITDKYIIKPYVRKYPITDELKVETLNFINSMADIFESKSDDESEWTPRNMTKPNGKEDTFYCNVLCNHRFTCKHIKRFNEMKQLSKVSDDDLF